MNKENKSSRNEEVEVREQRMYYDNFYLFNNNFVHDIFEFIIFSYKVKVECH